MADENTPGGEGENDSSSCVTVEQKPVTDEDVKKAEEFKETANGFFKSTVFIFIKQYINIW